MKKKNEQLHSVFIFLNVNVVVGSQVVNSEGHNYFSHMIQCGFDYKFTRFYLNCTFQAQEAQGTGSTRGAGSSRYAGLI